VAIMKIKKYIRQAYLRKAWFHGWHDNDRCILTCALSNHKFYN